jgi:hypothetical protein
MEKIKILLQHVELIKKKYEEIDEITGESFNLFDILNVNSDEVKHSLFISNLLDAKGTHKQKDLFLKLFISEIQEKFQSGKRQSLMEFATEKSYSKTEKHIGFKSDDISSGGRLDIIMNDGESNIIIENKIYAGDQEKQLFRYFNFDKKAPLIYLTLGDELPSKNSITHENIELQENVDFISISYETEVKKWIQSCIKVVYNKPIIRETLIQYEFLINELTNQSNNIKMSEDIRNLITTDNVELINFLNCEVLKIKSELTNIVINNFKSESVDLDDQLKLSIFLDEDSDGLFIGYSILENEKNMSKEHKNKGLYENFKNANPNLKIGSTDACFVWYNPIGYAKKQRLFHDKNLTLNFKEVIEFYHNRAALEEFIENIKKEEMEYRKNFLLSIIK